MAATYTPHYTRPHSHPNTQHHHHRPTTWPETQAALILTLRDISNPPRKSPDADVRALDEDRQIHARWTDPDLVDALVGVGVFLIIVVLSCVVFYLITPCTM